MLERIGADDEVLDAGDQRARDVGLPAHTTGASPMPVTPSSVSISTSTAWSAVVPWPLRRQLER